MRVERRQERDGVDVQGIDQLLLWVLDGGDKAHGQLACEAEQLPPVVGRVKALVEEAVPRVQHHQGLHVFEQLLIDVGVLHHGLPSPQQRPVADESLVAQEGHDVQNEDAQRVQGQRDEPDGQQVAVDVRVRRRERAPLEHAKVALDVGVKAKHVLSVELDAREVLNGRHGSVQVGPVEEKQERGGRPVEINVPIVVVRGAVVQVPGRHEHPHDRSQHGDHPDLVRKAEAEVALGREQKPIEVEQGAEVEELLQVVGPVHLEVADDGHDLDVVDQHVDGAHGAVGPRREHQQGHREHDHQRQHQSEQGVRRAFVAVSDVAIIPREALLAGFALVPWVALHVEHVDGVREFEARFDGYAAQHPSGVWIHHGTDGDRLGDNLVQLVADHACWVAQLTRLVQNRSPAPEVAPAVVALLGARHRDHQRVRTRDAYGLALLILVRVCGAHRAHGGPSQREGPWLAQRTLPLVLPGGLVERPRRARRARRLAIHTHAADARRDHLHEIPGHALDVDRHLVFCGDSTLHIHGDPLDGIQRDPPPLRVGEIGHAHEQARLRGQRDAEATHLTLRGAGARRVVGGKGIGPRRL
mmetsp:Transcript_36066/g.60776  ORF Transcript_36066/g.60776 Transcript_36066/m.60776 type:complete len:584 (+) Transcript_36066:419-2170(+)